MVLTDGDLNQEHGTAKMLVSVQESVHGDLIGRHGAAKMLVSVEKSYISIFLFGKVFTVLPVLQETGIHLNQVQSQAGISAKALLVECFLFASFSPQ